MFLGVRNLKKNTTTRKKIINIKRFVIALIVIVAVIYVSVTFFKQSMMLNKREEIVESLEKQISEENLRQKQLNKELENVKDPEYLERMAREKLGLVKANERVFIDVTKDK